MYVYLVYVHVALRGLITQTQLADVRQTFGDSVEEQTSLKCYCHDLQPWAPLKRCANE